MKYCLIGLIFLMGCAPPPRQDANLLAYLYSFEDYARSYGFEAYTQFDAVFVDKMKGSLVGTCGSSGITISLQYWKIASPAMREQLMFHELGHCSLGLGHVATLSIMNPYLLPETFYVDNRKRLFDELFVPPEQRIYVTPGSVYEDRVDWEEHD